MPKLRRVSSAGLWPRCFPITMTGLPSIRPMPPTIAAQSPDTGPGVSEPQRVGGDVEVQRLGRAGVEQLGQPLRRAQGA
jgi:hypothetical protein